MTYSPPFLVGIVPTYREGPLAMSAINSIAGSCNAVVVFEGPIGDAPLSGTETYFPKRMPPNVIVRRGQWKNEVHKRNAMLDFTRRYPTPTWGVYLDADEIMIGAEWLADMIYAASGNVPEDESPATIPLLITEVDSSVGRIHRLIRLDLLERHVLSMSQLKFYGSDVVPTFPLLPVWRPGETVTEFARPPMQGEPHIHHRSYYRPRVRTDFRMHKEEIEEFAKLEADAKLGIKVPGMIPVQQDPGFIVASEQGEAPPPFDPFGLLREE